MRSHMDVFFYLTKIKEDMNLSTKELKAFLESSFELSNNTELSTAQVERLAELFVQYQPETTQKVHYMRDKGYSPGYIKEYLQISASTVSYHLNRKEKPEYVNPHALGFIRNLETEKYRVY